MKLKLIKLNKKKIDNLNLNINEEINKTEKNKIEDKKEEDDLDANININDLIEEKKNKEKSRNLETESNENKIEKGSLSERKFVRSISYSNFDLEITHPQSVFLFDDNDFNIFGSFLIILNNNSYINKYFTKHQDKIYSSEKNNLYCLSIILYFINKYLWTRRPESIIKPKDLNSKYFIFLNKYLEVNCQNSNSEIYLYNTDNLEAIINFIFYKINAEITAEYKKEDVFNYDSGDALLNQFMKTFIKNNHSVISDSFTGFYQEEMTCLNCQNRMQRYGNVYIPFKQYSSFNYIYLDLDNCNNQCTYQNRRCNSFCDFGNGFNQFNSMNFIMNNNLYNCLNTEFNKSFQSSCNLCQFNTMKYIQKKIFSPPKILTIILNNKNANFQIIQEINLSQFTIIKGNHNYYLIGILCKYTYNNRFITYCFNYRDGSWYSYTKKEEKYSRSIKRVTYLEPNAIPYVLVYQNKENMDFEYNEINLDIANNKKGYTFRFQNGLPQATLYFGINTTVKEVCKDIERFYKLEKVKLIINAQQIKNSDILSSFVGNSDNILVIPA